METVRKDPLGLAWTAIVALGFTIVNLSVKVTSTQFGFSSDELASWRMLVPIPFLGIMTKAQDNTFSTSYWKTHLNHSVIGTLAMMCTFYSVIYLPLATGVALNYTFSIQLAIFSFFILKGRIALHTQAILIMGFIGIIFLLNPPFQGRQRSAALVSLVDGAMSGWAYLQVRELSLLGEPSWHVVSYLSFAGLVMGAVWSTITDWHPLTVSSLPYLADIGISATIAQLAMTRVYKVSEKFTVASLSYLAVVFSALSDVLLFSDKITWQEAVGMVIIVAGDVFSSLAPASIKKFLMKQ